MEQNKKKELKEASSNAEESEVTDSRNVTNSPVFVNSNISGSVTYNTGTYSSPTIESPLKFERVENYYTLKDPVIFAGQTESTEYKVVQDFGCKCGGKCKKNDGQSNHDHRGSKISVNKSQKSTFFRRLLDVIFFWKK